MRQQWHLCRTGRGALAALRLSSWCTAFTPLHPAAYCRTFAQSGTCPYGTRCRFIHSTAPPSPAPFSSSCGVNGGSSGVPTGDATPTVGTPTPPMCNSKVSQLARCAVVFSMHAQCWPGRQLVSACQGLIKCLHAHLQEPSFNSLHGLATPAAHPTSPLPGYATGVAIPGAGSLLPAFGAPDASLMGLQSSSILGTCPQATGFPATTNTTATVSTTFGGYGPIGGFAPAAPAGAGDVNMLAALTALLGSAHTPPAAPPLGAASLTAAAAATSLGLGVVGTPAGLPAIGIRSGLSAAAAQQLPSCPATPVGTSATGVVPAMRRSISGGQPNV